MNTRNFLDNYGRTESPLDYRHQRRSLKQRLKAFITRHMARTARGLR